MTRNDTYCNTTQAISSGFSFFFKKVFIPILAMQGELCSLGPSPCDKGRDADSASRISCFVFLETGGFCIFAHQRHHFLREPAGEAGVDSPK